jgi:hypothetical protein
MTSQWFIDTMQHVGFNVVVIDENWRPPMEATIKQHLWSTKALITIANAMSTDIDEASIDTAASLEPHERERIMNELTSVFEAICSMLRERDIEITDVVVCPKEW